MKKLLVGLMMVGMGLLIMTTVASAYPVSIGDQITLNWGIGNANGGGAFNVDKVGDSAGVLFDTFCVERNEFISIGAPYYIGNISGGAVNGGWSGQETTNYDPISSKTAYLFSRWANQSLTNHIDHTAANANALQLAIWSLEGELTTNPITLTPAAIAFIASASDARGYYGVAVMNLYGSRSGSPGQYNYTGVKQDMLVVPEPATMLLLGLALIGLAGVGRKFKK